jgi:hypothetical protein
MPTVRNPPPPIPPTPLWLGAGGLVPFIVLAGALWVLPTEYHPFVYDWLRSYAAVILSFIGALHWGFAMVHNGMANEDRNVLMTWSVVPALVAWVGLLAPVTPGLVLTATMFVIQYTMDRTLVRRFTFPSWYLRLRSGLTVVVVACLAVAAIR